MDPKTLPQMPAELLMLVGAMCHVRGEAEAKQAAATLQAWGAACYAAGMDRAAEVCAEVQAQAWALWKTTDDPIEQGRSIGADHCADDIRAAKGE